MTVTVVGGGLAGCEAAWALAQRGIRVTLVEMENAFLPELAAAANELGTLLMS